MDKIFSLIEERTKQELEKISEEKERAVFELKERFTALCQKEKEVARDEAKENFKKVLLEYEQKLFQQNNFVLLAEKQKIIGQVFDVLAKSLSEEKNELLADLLVAIVKKIDFPLAGEIVAGEKTAPLLVKIIRTGLKVKPGLNEDGFLVLGDGFELDFRLGQIINNIKPAAMFETSKIIFS